MLVCEETLNQDPLFDFLLQGVYSMTQAVKLFENFLFYMCTYYLIKTTSYYNKKYAVSCLQFVLNNTVGL